MANKQASKEETKDEDLDDKSRILGKRPAAAAGIPS